MTGVAAHIVAAAKNGPRSDPSLSSANRRAASNGIWMCAVHAKWIDDNESIATVEKLREWKQQHESEIAAWQEHGHKGILKSWDRLAALTRDQRDAIETALPNGHAVARDGTTLITNLKMHSACLVTGDSGVGKSALVKSTLDEHFPEARQVWLGPEAITKALSEADREQIGLTAPILDLLQAVTTSSNILVLDAVERVNTETVSRLGQLIGRLAMRHSDQPGKWSVVAIAQQSGFEAHLDPLLRNLDCRTVTVPPASREEVREALLSASPFAQHAFDNAFLDAISNLRALAWVVAADSSFGSGVETGTFTRTEIADRLWKHWTGDSPHAHKFLIGLARRDADYERSFALSELSDDELTIWNEGRQRLPVKLDETNRLSFEHDLASDWARYQYLKEISEDVTKWSDYAGKPLWIAALRLFGLYLLNKPNQAAGAWDGAFSEARTANNSDATDVLLDALCLAPNADILLAKRTSLLFTNDGELLNRLLRRFLHVATVPKLQHAEPAEKGFALYAEALIRSPVWTSWPPLIRFLKAHQNTIASFGLLSVAKICQLWLTEAPTKVGEKETIGRKELAHIALETARVHQINDLAEGVFWGGSKSEEDVYCAALAGARDQKDPVCQFALELARRRPIGSDTAAKVALVEDEHRKLLEARKSKRPRLSPEDKFLSNAFRPKELPPWPLGPQGTVSTTFRQSVLNKGALGPLMSAAPDVAAEVLLACVIEDNPHEDTRSMRLDRNLGLQSDHSDQPIIYWNSPFFLFLSQSPDFALESLLQLVEFCTSKWSEAADGAPADEFAILLDSEASLEYKGNWQVLDWSHMRYGPNSQLYSALDALERWLFLKIKNGEDISEICAKLLAGSKSAAILGVLIDCAKLEPRLLQGELRALMTSPDLILADEWRLRQRSWTDAFTWNRAGEAMTKIGLEWEQADHRRQPLKDIIRDLRRSDSAFEELATKLIAEWSAEDGLDFRVRSLIAELNPQNWRATLLEDGEAGWELEYPPDIKAELATLREAEPKQPTLGQVLARVETALGARMNDDQAAEWLSYIGDQNQFTEFDPEERVVFETAIAAALFANAGSWIEQDPSLADKLVRTLEQSLPPLKTLLDDPRQTVSDYGTGLAWASIGAVCARANCTMERQRLDRIIRLGLATADVSITSTIISTARSLRTKLGATQGSIVEAGILAAALYALSPRWSDDPGASEVLTRWKTRLIDLSLDTKPLEAGRDLTALSRRIERIWRARFRRLKDQEISGLGRHNLRKRYSLILASHLIAVIYRWALDDQSSPEPEEIEQQRQAIRLLWSFVDWHIRGEPQTDIDDDEGFDRLDDFGISIVRKIAALVPLGQVKESRPLWEPVLALGPRGEFTVEHMIDCYFLRLYKEADPKKFIANWDAMLAFVFDPEWIGRGKWWKARSIRRHLLGINAGHQITSQPEVAAHLETLAPYFETFAAEHLKHDDHELAAFASFFAEAVGATLRMRAAIWIDECISQSDAKLSENAGNALAELVTSLLESHSKELMQNESSREAMNNIVKRLVRDQLPYSLTLQDRARSLR